ncbi:MAG: D-alanine--D-alanine ligase [Nitrospirota bacterium]|nr:D-alanine--D-alanine ligase [Nitrospirota bacterium]
MKIAVVYTLRREPLPGQPSDYYAEGDDPRTIDAVVSALSTGHDAIAIEDDSDLCRKLIAAKPDIIFNMAEGVAGEDREARVPALLELMGIPYTGSTPATLAMTLNKATAKEILRYHSIPVAQSVIVSRNGHLSEKHGLALPLMVKPLHEGSSKGVRDNSLVHAAQELKERITFIHDTYRQPALVEEYLPGREFTAAILGNGDEARVLPLIEINHAALPSGANPIYSWEAKWVWDTTDKPLDIFLCPAPVDDTLKERIEQMALAAYEALRCRDWCRVDLRLDDAGVPHLLELNPLPGILPGPADNSCFPKAARAAGMEYDALIRTVVEIARKRYGS